MQENHPKPPFLQLHSYSCAPEPDDHYGPSDSDQYY